MGGLCSISGEAGIGKTALVEQFVNQYCSDSKAAVGGLRSSYLPRARLDRSTILPLRLRAACLRSWVATRSVQRCSPLFLDELQKSPLPTVVVFEDVHWADEATLDLIKFLGRRIPHLPVLFLVTYRDNELSPEHPLWSVIG